MSSRISNRSNATRSTLPLIASQSLPPQDFSELRRRLILDGCKWDPQVGDVSALASFPLFLERGEWHNLASWAESLTAEAFAAEREILQRPELLTHLGLPRALRALFRKGEPLTPTLARVIRFDFHYTTDGWRISEANTDVPGGYTEAGTFSRLMAAHFPGYEIAGDPAAAIVEAIAATTEAKAPIALLSAPGYLEDHQVISFLAARLREENVVPILASPHQLQWREGLAYCLGAKRPLAGIIKFYQAEWLARFPSNTNWPLLFCGGKTPVLNPLSAVVTESKRFPLLWPLLKTPLPTWRALLPETRDPREVFGQDSRHWVLKTSFCNTGDAVCMRDVHSPSTWLRSKALSTLAPSQWVAQRRFESVPLDTPDGPRHACIGVYTVNGRAAGAYARLAVKPLIDYAAVDVALLLHDDE